MDASHVVELDSSSAVKWSRHVIVRLPGAALATFQEAKTFVLQAVLSHPDAVRLLVHKLSARDGLTQISFVDSSVYTKCASQLSNFDNVYTSKLPGFFRACKANKKKGLFDLRMAYPEAKANR